MTGGPGESWQEREARRRRVAEEARKLDREPAAWWARLVLGVTLAAWVASIAWMVATLPDRVPTHWSASGTPDGWSSKTGALAFVVLLPALMFFPMIWLSRLVLVWPQGVNAPYKEWWLDRPRRLVRFERLLREDLMVIVSVSVLLMVAIDLIMGYAAHQPGGTVPAWWFPVVTVAYLVVLTAVTVRMLVSRRYRPDDDDPELA